MAVALFEAMLGYVPLCGQRRGSRRLSELSLDNGPIMRYTLRNVEGEDMFRGSLPVISLVLTTTVALIATVGVVLVRSPGSG